MAERQSSTGRNLFIAVFVVLNVMLSRLIVRPIRRMPQSADKLSIGEFGEPGFKEKGGGGFGITYLARDGKLHLPVAIDQPDQRELFLQALKRALPRRKP